ncbi:MAG: hypothetical protein K0S56_1950 [Microvirga sp.]|nr:hypothetical protein [Microvirga sp.]
MSDIRRRHLPVMAGLDPATHVFWAAWAKAWVPGSSPGMTWSGVQGCGSSRPVASWVTIGLAISRNTPFGNRIEIVNRVPCSE